MDALLTMVGHGSRSAAKCFGSPRCPDKLLVFSHGTEECFSQNGHVRLPPKRIFFIGMVEAKPGKRECCLKLSPILRNGSTWTPPIPACTATRWQISIKLASSSRNGRSSARGRTRQRSKPFWTACSGWCKYRPGSHFLQGSSPRSIPGDRPQT